MTTEIAVINRLGVALAADSAVTIPGYDGADKVFDTGDKLFELSDEFSIALMVNGSMDFLGVPWEVIVKEFRCRQPPRASELSIKDWMKAFLDFLAVHPTVKPEEVQRWQEGLIRDEVEDLNEKVKTRLEQEASRDGKQPLQQLLQRLYTDVMKEEIEALVRDVPLDSLGKVKEDDIVPTVRSLVGEMKLELPFSTDKDLDEFFVRLVAQRLLKDLDRLTQTGIVVCGFGGSKSGVDLFPSLCAIEIDGFIVNRLRYSQSHHVTITRGEDTGTAISFAQTDVIDRLLRGTDNRFIDGGREFISKNVTVILSDIFDRLKFKIVDKQGQEIELSQIGQMVGELIAARFESKFVASLTQEFERKFQETIALMPKQDLIELAEALVNITAIERKASDDAGTVGGPIDVALITRSEGFVWVKRKHHFQAELNPRYMWRQFKSK